MSKKFKVPRNSECFVDYSYQLSELPARIDRVTLERTAQKIREMARKYNVTFVLSEKKQYDNSNYRA